MSSSTISPPPPPGPASVASTAEWKRTQEYTFTRWVNQNLTRVGKSIGSLRTDFSDGLALIALVEVLSGKKLPKHQTKPVFRSQKMDNVTLALQFLKKTEKVQLVNIGPADIVDSKIKLILGLIWHLILHYSISKPSHVDGGFGIDKNSDLDSNCSQNHGQGSTARKRLLAWLQARMPEVPVTNFTTDWVDGRYLGYLVHTFDVTLCSDWYRWDPRAGRCNVKHAMEIAEKNLGVAALIEPEDVADRDFDEPCMMTYLAQFKNARPKVCRPPPTCSPPSPPPPTPTTPAGPHPPCGGPDKDKDKGNSSSFSKCKAFGQGLQFGTAGQQNRFIVDTRPAAVAAAAKGKSKGQPCSGSAANAVRLGLAIEGPSETQLTCTDNDDGFWTIDYKPDEPGEYTISVRLNDEHVEKSPFQVHVRSSPSTGASEGGNKPVAVTNCNCKYCQSLGLEAGKGNQDRNDKKCKKYGSEHKGQVGQGQPFSVSILGRNSPQYAATDKDRDRDREHRSRSTSPSSKHHAGTTHVQTVTFEENSGPGNGRTCGTKPATTTTGATHEVSVTTTIDLGTGKTKSKVTRNGKEYYEQAKHEAEHEHAAKSHTDTRKYPPIPHEWLPRKSDKTYRPIPSEWLRPSYNPSEHDDDEEVDIIYKSKGHAKSKPRPPKVVVHESCPCKDCRAKGTRHRQKIVVWTDTQDEDGHDGAGGGRNERKGSRDINVDRNVPYRETIVSSTIEIHHPQDSCHIM